MPGFAADKELNDYMHGNTDAAIVTVAILREPLENGVEHITIQSVGNDGKPVVLYEFWNSKKKGPGKESAPKRVGGKASYTKLMSEEIKRLHNEGLQGREESLGVLLFLSGNVEWGTGRLINKRSKKPLKYEDLEKLLGYSNKKMNRVIADLKRYGYMSHTAEGYIVSNRIMQKGVSEKGKGKQGDV